jgi:hypothetical protein
MAVQLPEKQHNKITFCGPNTHHAFHHSRMCLFKSGAQFFALLLQESAELFVSLKLYGAGACMKL